MTVRHVLIALNLVAVVAIAAYLIWAVLSPKRAPEDAEPANLTPYLEDDELESRRLERVQSWALLFAAVVAVALPLYWLHEPARQKESSTYFSKNAAERGEVLFSNSAMPKYEAASSLGCASCHGADGQGGTVKFQVAGQPRIWQAPPLNTVLLRFKEDPGCANIDTQSTSVCNVTNIITNGRPGTPMPPWGVSGGGSKNVQAIQDLVAFISSIQLTPKQAQAQAAKNLEQAKSDDPTVGCPEFMTCPAMAVTTARATLKTDNETLDGSRAALQKALGAGAPDTDTDLAAACTEIDKQVSVDPAKVKKQGLACRTYTADATLVATDQAALAWDLEWVKRRANVSEGQELFEMNCARCHTQSWSTFNPTIPPDQPGGVGSLGLPGGGGGLGGGIGFNLRDNDGIRRFGTDEAGGFQAQVDFVGTGSIPYKLYGNDGTGSGKMPGFTKMLTSKQIKEIVSYERYCLDQSTFLEAEPVCEAPDHGRTAPTTTTAAKG